ncbi:1-acyl-sn-glycerol-3-phosphate acyltransferase [Arthrobacter sp. NEB 688]|uniref:1-acyl-sn-glycerol-3-phosphate acyltransferase n=1 Tax=Arthrobacter sp. NEB 688 TaxID=904039 RepID=UPI0015648458|nr:1-acyl-sn-glycerol-3-phosphate acyltransferase [Arthrobacter sp. NEB 688]QKE85292.1 acyl-phosphate glycerol 3-phosphate acyltransferase [Arthrobacter sp. NEB 688]
MRVALAKTVLRAARWRAVGEVPRTGILVGAPHTSNWDFVMMLLVMWRGDVTPRVLIKQELFKGPLGWLLHRLGGIPLDRDNPGQVVRELVREARSGEPFLLILAAEGTRDQGEYWKSGFWRIARAAKLPIALAFIDGPSRTAGFGPTIRATPDVRADMDLVREFYRDKRGIHPEKRTEPRLREEDRPAGA